MNSGETNQNETMALAGIYFNKLYKVAASFVKIEKADVVVDFGCGTQRLKAFLSPCHYVGYDIEPKYSDVNSFKILKPDIIFSLSCLEHLDKKQLEEFCSWAAKAKPRFLIVSVPCEYLTNKFLRFIFARDFVNEVYHLTHWRDSARILNKRFELMEVKRLWLMSWITVWKPKKLVVEEK